MKICTSSWSFTECSLKEAVDISKAIGIHATDIGFFHRPALDKKRLLSNPESYAEEIGRMDFTIPTFYYLFGENLIDRNLANPRFLEENLKDFQQAIKFSKVLGIKNIFIIPGVVNPGQTRQDAFKASKKSIQAIHDLADKNGLQIGIEPHVHSYLETPTLVMQLLNEVEGLKLVLDYSHFLCLGYRQEEIDPLAPYTMHLHLRQAKPGSLQTKMEEGTINMFALFGLLGRLGYEGYIALEAVHQNYMATVYDDVLTEIIKMRDAFYKFEGRTVAEEAVKRF